MLIRLELQVIGLMTPSLIMSGEIMVLWIGAATAERVKHEMGCAFPGNELTGDDN